MKTIKQENSSTNTPERAQNAQLPLIMTPVPYFYPVTPMYNYGPFVASTSQVPSLNSEFEKMVQEINNKYSAQGLSDSLGMLLAHPQQALKGLNMSPPATPMMSPDRTFVCSISNCGKKFTSKQSLKSHMAIHVDDKFKPFDCAICGILHFIKIRI